MGAPKRDVGGVRHLERNPGVQGTEREGCKVARREGREGNLTVWRRRKRRPPARLRRTVVSFQGKSRACFAR